MGVPTQTTGPYRDALGGLHEIPQYATTNAFGQTVMSSGGFYNSQGQVINPSSPRPSSPRPFSPISFTPSGGSSTPRTTAKSVFQSAINNANTGVDSAKAAAGRIQGNITNTRADLDAARMAAGNITGSITNVNNAALALGTDINAIRNNAGSLDSLYQQLISGDTSMGGAGADYLDSVRMAGDALLAINPDAYVASAASDAQASAQNTEGQMMREMSRRGVNVGSGAYAALMGQMNRAKATALAAAKTAARRQGLSDRATALTQRAGLYQGVLDKAQSAAQQATSDYATAAGLVTRQGDMFAQAGSLAQQQANTYANIGGIEVNLGQLDLQSEGVVQDAIANVTAAQQAMAKFYQDTMTQTTRKTSWGGMDTTTTSYS